MRNGETERERETSPVDQISKNIRGKGGTEPWLLLISSSVAEMDWLSQSLEGNSAAAAAAALCLSVVCTVHFTSNTSSSSCCCWTVKSNWAELFFKFNKNISVPVKHYERSEGACINVFQVATYFFFFFKEEEVIHASMGAPTSSSREWVERLLLSSSSSSSPWNCLLL